MYYLQNGEILSSTASESAEPRSVAEKMASITDEEIVAMFDKKIEIVEIKAKEVVGDGMDYFLRHKTSAIVAGVLVLILPVVGWVVMRVRNANIRNDDTGESQASQAPLELPAMATVDKVCGKDDDEAGLASPHKLFSAEFPSKEDEREGCAFDDEVESVPESVNTNYASDKSLEDGKFSRRLGEGIHLSSDDTSNKSIVAATTRNKICIRTPIKNGVLRTPIRKKRVQKED